MNDPNTESVEKKATALRIAVPTIIPFFVAFYSIQGTILFGEHFGLNAVPRLLVGWCVVLLASGAWLTRVLFRRADIRLPFAAQAACVQYPTVPSSNIACWASDGKHLFLGQVSDSHWCA